MSVAASSHVLLRRSTPCAGRRAPGGFSLIEILVVIVILSILGAMVIPNIINKPDQARVAAAKQDAQAIVQALKLYKLDNGVYPSADQGLKALVEKPTAGNLPRNWNRYLDKLPNDPWGHPYVYMNPGVKNEVDVMSYGANGQPGGEGVDADIGSWD